SAVQGVPFATGGVSGLTGLFGSVQSSAQGMQGTPEVGVSGGQPHGLLEFPQCVPPPPLLHADPGEVHMRKLAWLVSLRLLRRLEPGHRLLELPLLHQIAADVVVGVAEVGIDVDGAQALMGRLLQTTLEAVCPSQEGVSLGGRLHLDRALIELDRTVELPPHLVLVSLFPDLGGSIEAFGGAHTVTRSARPRAAGPCPRTSTRNDWSPGSGPASRRAPTASAARPPGPSPPVRPGRRRRTPRRRRYRSSACRGDRPSRRARAPCRPPSRSSSRAGVRPSPRETERRTRPPGDSSCRRGSSALRGSRRRRRASARSRERTLRGAHAPP